MSNKNVELAKDAIKQLKTAKKLIMDAYVIFIKSGLSPKNAKAICKNYINDSTKEQE